MTSVSIADFHQDIAAAEAASLRGPVFITDEGEPRRVLIDIEEYRKLTVREPFPEVKAEVSSMTLYELALRLPALPDELVDYEFPKLKGTLRAAELD